MTVRGRAHQNRDDAGLMPRRIVRCAVGRVRDAVAVRVTSIPAAALVVPAIVALDPGRRRVVITPALALPIPGMPDMPMAFAFPISGNPEIASARRGDRFNPQWRRCRVEVDLDFGACRHWGRKAAERSGASAANNDLRNSMSTPLGKLRGRPRG